MNAMAKANHPNGPSWSIPLNKDMRKHDASSQRTANTRINPQTARELGESVMGYSSAPSEYNNQGGFTAPTASVGIDYSGPTFAGFDAADYSGPPGAGFAAADAPKFGDSMSGLSNLSFEQQMSYEMQQSLQTNRSNSISPVLPTNLNATAFSNTSNTPEHLSTLRDRLMEYSMDYSTADDDREDAIGLMSLLDNDKDPARVTMMRYSSNLHQQGQKQNDTPNRAPKTIQVFRTVKKQRK